MSYTHILTYTGVVNICDWNCMIYSKLFLIKLHTTLIQILSNCYFCEVYVKYTNTKGVHRASHN